MDYPVVVCCLLSFLILLHQTVKWTAVVAVPDFKVWRHFPFPGPNASLKKTPLKRHWEFKPAQINKSIGVAIHLGFKIKIRVKEDLQGLVELASS